MNEREAFEATELFRELPLYAKEASKDGYLNRSLDNEYKIFCLGYKAALASQAQQESINSELLKVAEAALDWIDCVPSDTPLPIMSGFDRDWADRVIADANESIASQAQQPAKPFIYISEDEFAWRSKSGDLNGTRSLTCITPQHFGEKHYGNFTVPLYLQSQAQQSQWISVEERLPETKEMIISARKRADDTWGLDLNYWTVSNRFAYKYTHWMPLPPAPEGEAK